MADVVPVQITLSNGAKMPHYQTAGAAGADLCCLESFEIGPMARAWVRTGVSIAIPAGFEGQVRPRSGLAAKHGITLVNSPGTIDCDYRGELKVIMINLGTESVLFNAGDRIAQLVICPVMQAQFEVVADLIETARGTGGFGSTGS